MRPFCSALLQSLETAMTIEVPDYLKNKNMPEGFAMPSADWVELKDDCFRLRYRIGVEGQIEYTVEDLDCGAVETVFCSIKAFLLALSASLDDGNLTDEEYAEAETAIGVDVRWIPW